MQQLVFPIIHAVSIHRVEQVSQVPTWDSHFCVRTCKRTSLLRKPLRRRSINKNKTLSFVFKSSETAHDAVVRTNRHDIAMMFARPSVWDGRAL